MTRTIYVDVETAVSLPLRMLMANAITDPMKVPNWNIAEFDMISVDEPSASEMKHTPEYTKHLSLVLL
jgi:hypothetical protein